MSTTTEAVTAIRTGIDVPVAPERAFEVYTSGMDTWWDREHHVQAGALVRIGVDPFAGGRMWEENDAGDICVWGRVLIWEPPSRFAFSWRIGPDWGVPREDAPESTVTVTFSPIASGTHVELVHGDLDAHGKGWQGIRDAVGGEGGWPAGMRRFAAIAVG
jgi:uncharacterized protein YndB with AHSA1/START domain